MARAFRGPKKGYPQAVVFSRDGALLFVGHQSSNQVAVYDVPTGKRVKRFKVDPKSCVGLAISADGHWLASGGEKHLKAWDLRELLK